MAQSRTISVYEHNWLTIGQHYGEAQFEGRHLELLSQYLTLNPGCGFYQLYHKRVKFSNYVGVIKVGDLSIEVLPKSDNQSEDEKTWRNVLLQMLSVSLQVNAKTTTQSNIELRRHTVLETYIWHFLRETESVFRKGLVKQYRTDEGNQLALRGKLQIHKQITHNLIHNERFYVAHQVYDRNNVYNAILEQTLRCILSLEVSPDIIGICKDLLLFFPECKSINVSEKLFQRLTYGRKTERYKNAIELARVILLNYHPDLKGGRNNILAIMFDMNQLWENYIYYILKRSTRHFGRDLIVEAQRRRSFWRHPDNYDLRLKPDLVLQFPDSSKTIVVDTKWKYKSDTSIEDVRQMYAYGHYFGADEVFLLYPGRLNGNGSTDIRRGVFYSPGSGKDFSNDYCGIIIADILRNGCLNLGLGMEILSALETQSNTTPINQQQG